MRLEQPKTSYSAYVKAGLVFAASTAAFLLAKTTGFLPNWPWAEGDDDSQGLIVSEETSGAGLGLVEIMSLSSAEASLTTSPLEKGGREDFAQSLSSDSTDDLTITEEDLDPSPIRSTQRRSLPLEVADIESMEGTVASASQVGALKSTQPSTWSPSGKRRLQTNSGLRITGSIPDQVIPIGQPWRYDVSDVFSSSNPFVLGAIIQGRQPLLPWLGLQPKLLSTYPAGSGGAAFGCSGIWIDRLRRGWWSWFTGIGCE